ncbi:DUF2617 family protein [Actinoallomurus purpureus]|uniref:DUF2617 family protein n=1 Tax=Actinoallomurus purpureus TaxID=478114 RepID=UPI0020934EBC|nr:DUF2617 family protein [Actinoallomurus purpureus]MCO6008876.1 DUF2617 family protein [Actinoallomurus purpureus]
MLADLDVPYADTGAHTLSFALGLAPQDALAVLPVERAGLSLELRLLGASHQVLAGPVSETVACLAGGGPLPGRVSHALPSWSYEFTADVVAHDGDAAFARAVEALSARLSGRDDALTGTFPGSPYAVTALAVEPEPGGVAWRTWHAYPQTKEIVMTRSRLVSPR